MTARLLAWLVPLAACASDEPAPITEVNGPRVLAITTEPSALHLDGVFELGVLTVDPDGPRAELPAGERPVEAVRMRACAPWKFVVDPERDCVGGDAVPLARNANGRFAISAPVLAAAFPAPPGTPSTSDPWRAALAAKLAIRVPIITEVDVGGRTLVAKRLVDVIDGETVRRNPRLVDIRFDGAPIRTLRAGQRYTMTAIVDRASLDEPPIPSEDSPLERVTGYFFATAGEIEDPEASVVSGDAAELETEANTYTAGSPGRAWLFVVANDETGGASAISLPLTIE